MILMFKYSGREKSGKTTSSCIDIDSLKTFIRNRLVKLTK
jgi:hypothetical protein